MKFNIRLVIYLLMYIFGVTALLKQGANPVVIACFGLISIVTVMLIRFGRPILPPENKPPILSEEDTGLTTTSEAMKKELDMAHRVQQALLSIAPPKHPHLEIARKCNSADSVGGDFYFFVSQGFSELQEKPKRPGITSYIGVQDEYIGVAIGDVAGHGVSSALVMALSSGLISEIAHSERRPSAILAKANNHILKHIENSQVRYVTCAFATFFPAQRKMLLATAGHPPVFIIRTDGSLHYPASKGVFLACSQMNLTRKKASFYLQEIPSYFIQMASQKQKTVLAKNLALSAWPKRCKTRLEKAWRPQSMRYWMKSTVFHNTPQQKTIEPSY